MKKALFVSASILVVAGLVWAGQEKGGQDMPPAPKPSKEHEMLKEGVGTWDYVMKFKMGPDAPEQEIKGVETCTMLGGFWLLFDLKTDNMMGQPWQAHGTLGYDPDKKKYVGTFIESMSPNAMTGEGTADATGKVLTMVWTGKHHQTGKVETMREVSERKDKDHGLMTMYTTGPDGKEQVLFTINYTRKK